MVFVAERVGHAGTVIAEASRGLEVLRLQLISEAKSAMVKMYPGKIGLAVGVNKNVGSWKLKENWETFDIIPRFGTTYSGNAKQLSKEVEGKKFDYILFENVPISRIPSLYLEDGIGYKDLLRQSFESLNENGVLIVQSTDVEKKGIFRHGIRRLIRELRDSSFLLASETNGALITLYARKIR